MSPPASIVIGPPIARGAHPDAVVAAVHAARPGTRRGTRRQAPRLRRTSQASTSERSQCVSASSSQGLAATSSWFDSVGRGAVAAAGLVLEVGEAALQAAAKLRVVRAARRRRRPAAPAAAGRSARPAARCRMPASGDDDSPMAKRGWRPRSSRTTRRPSRRATIARIEPPMPDPTMTRSEHRASHTPPAAARDLLVAVHEAPSRDRRAVSHGGSGTKRSASHRSASTTGPPSDKPYSTAASSACEPRRLERRLQRLHGAVAAPRRNHGAARARRPPPRRRASGTPTPAPGRPAGTAG